MNCRNCGHPVDPNAECDFCGAYTPCPRARTRTLRDKRYPRDVQYLDGDTLRDGVALERNGSLTLVQDKETGESDWRGDFEFVS